MKKIEKITPTHRNIFTGVKVEVSSQDRENTTYRTSEPVTVFNLVIRDFTKPTDAFNQCYEKLS
jgi:hypothetical protein